MHSNLGWKIRVVEPDSSEQNGGKTNGAVTTSVSNCFSLIIIITMMTMTILVKETIINRVTRDIFY